MVEIEIKINKLREITIARFDKIKTNIEITYETEPNRQIQPQPKISKPKPITNRVHKNAIKRMEKCRAAGSSRRMHMP